MRLRRSSSSAIFPREQAQLGRIRREPHQAFEAEPDALEQVHRTLVVLRRDRHDAPQAEVAPRVLERRRSGLARIAVTPRLRDEREADVEKAWKLAVGDWKEREHWRDYIRAYEDALSETSTDYAPWHVIPADRKWLRDHLVSRTIVETLRPYRKQWLAKLEKTGETAKAELDAFRGSRPTT